MLGTPRIQATHNSLGAWRGHKDRTRKDVVNAFAVSPIRCKRLAPFIKVMPPWIHKSHAQYIELHRLRAKPPDTATIQMLDTIGRFHMTVDIDRLVHVKLTVVAPTQGVKQMMRIFSAKA